MIDASTLERIPLLRGAGAGARRELAARATLRRFAAGEVLWTAGGEPRGLYVVLEGRVRVLRSTGGRQHVVHVEEAGGTLGEVPLFSGGRYPATAVAAEDTLCVALGRDALHAAVHADPEFAFALLERLAGRVRALVERLDRLAARSVAARLAAFLLERHREGRGAPFGLGCTQTELAEELGTVREVLVREMGRLRRRGVLHAAGRGRWTVADDAALRRAAEGSAGG
ncbi:MAG TPA: Crp/Fnr family transcriptional regulator [Longimicrobiaceae bacterium]|nr:Crp/Fnr family transcriptional regulator [Longimicrobiaceae bacterium]